jgi:hypothetical protein
MAKKIDIRIKRKATYVKAPRPKAKKERVVKAKKAPKGNTAFRRLRGLVPGSCNLGR